MARRLTPIKAIRAKCLECSGESVKEVRECQITNCALFQYRMGTNPARQGQGGDIQKNIMNFPKTPDSTKGF